MNHRLLQVLLVLALSVSSLLAQSEAGGATLNGTVTDPTGAAVPGAKVTVTNVATGLTRDSQTNVSGLYSFTRLPVGQYNLVVNVQGFKAAQKRDLTLNVGAVVTFDVPLEVGSAAESVTVNADVPVVETSRSQTSTVVTEKAVRDLPVNGRNFLDFTLLTPGVARDPRGGDLSFGGQRGTANSLLVDGADSNNLFFGQSLGRTGVRNPYAFSQDSVQEFQVNTNSYSAELGRAGGGVINVVTRSGTNGFHGTAFEFFRDRGLNANTAANKSAVSAAFPQGRPKGAYHYNQYGGNVGGPIKKDKMFFFFNYDGQRNNNPNVLILGVTAPTDAVALAAYNSLLPLQVSYATSLKNDTYLGKVDWNLNATNTVTVRYNAGRFTGHNFENAGVTSAPEHTGDSLVTTDNVASSWTHIFGPTAVLDSRFVYQRDDEPGAANSNLPETTVRQGGATVISFGRNSFSPRYTNNKGYQSIETLALTRGRHSLKFGSDLNFLRIVNYFPGNFNGVYNFNSLAAYQNRLADQYIQNFPGANTGGAFSYPNISELAFFVQDNWRATDRLTLNLGLRYDIQLNAQPPVRNPDAALAALKLDTSRINTDSNNLGGRFGFAYRLTQGDRMVLRGGAGMFYARTPAILTGTAHTQNGIQVQSITLNANVPAQAALIPPYPNILSTAPANQAQNLFVMDPRFVNPLTYQWSLNLETQLASDYALTLGYLGVRGTHLARTRDINLFPAVPTAGVFDVNGTQTAFTFPRFSSTRPLPQYGRISLFESGADSIYHGGFIQLTKRFSQRFQLQTSYTYSHVIDSRPDATAVVVGSDDGKIVQDQLNPNTDRGNGDSDVRHRFIFAGIWDINYANTLQNGLARQVLGGWQLSPIVNLQSGRFFNLTVGGGDLNNDGNTRNDRVPFVGRNSLEGPGLSTVDLRVSKDFSLFGGERVRLRLIGEAFNLLNRNNIVSFQQAPYNFTVTSGTYFFRPAANYLFQTSSALDAPRTLQLAARFTF